MIEEGLPRESRGKRVFLPDTVETELELNGRRPPPDKNEEETRKQSLIRKEIRKHLIHEDQREHGDRRASCKLPTSPSKKRAKELKTRLDDQVPKLNGEAGRVKDFT